MLIEMVEQSQTEMLDIKRESLLLNQKTKIFLLNEYF